MAKTDKKVEVTTCSKSNSSSCPSLDDEEYKPYDVLLQNSHMISLQCKKYKKKIQISICENTELKK